MTIDEIKALVSSGIEGQGSMVDVGGVLADILNAVCDAIEEGGGVTPMFVAGRVDEGRFSPTDYSFEDAKEAFLAGTPVFMQYNDPDSGTQVNYAITYAGVTSGEATEILGGSGNNVWYNS